MTYYLSLHIFCLFTSAIDFNVVNPSNNTLNRKKIIITIFVNETKCIFEKNYKKNHSKNDSKKLLQTPLQKKTPDIMTSVYHNAMSIWGGGGDVPNSSSKIDHRKEFKGLGAIRAKIGPSSDVDKFFSKMYSQYVLFRNKYS